MTQCSPDSEMEKQMLEDFSDLTFERDLAQIKNIDRHMRKIRGLTAVLKAAREYISANHDVASAVEAGKLLYAIDSALTAEPAPAQPAPFYGATCPTYPNCQGGCGLGCRHEIEQAAQPREEIQQAITDLVNDGKVGFLSVRHAYAIADAIIALSRPLRQMTDGDGK